MSFLEIRKKSYGTFVQKIFKSDIYMENYIQENHTIWKDLYMYMYTRAVEGIH